MTARTVLQLPNQGMWTTDGSHFLLLLLAAFSSVATHIFSTKYMCVCVCVYIYICMYIYVLRIYVCHTSLQALHACIINYSSTQTAEHSCCVPTVRYIYILNPFIFTAQNQLYTLFLYHTTVDVVLIRPQQFDVRHIVSSYSSKFKLHNLLSCVTLKGFRLTVHVNSLCF